MTEHTSIEAEAAEAYARMKECEALTAAAVDNARLALSHSACTVVLSHHEKYPTFLAMRRIETAIATSIEVLTPALADVRFALGAASAAREVLGAKKAGGGQ